MNIFIRQSGLANVVWIKEIMHENKKGHINSSLGKVTRERGIDTWRGRGLKGMRGGE